MKSNYQNILGFDSQPNVALSNCIVIAVEEETPVVVCAGITSKAKIAFSCLVKPEVGDLVLCSLKEQGDCYILGILERPKNRQMDLNFPEDVNFRVGKGKLGFYSKEAITLATGGEHHVIAKNITMASKEAHLTIGQVTAKGSRLVACYKNIAVIGQAIDTMVKSLIQRVKMYVRHTEEHDQVKAANMMRNVKGLYTLDSQYTMMISKKDTKIDGERIHMA